MTQERRFVFANVFQTGPLYSFDDVIHDEISFVILNPGAYKVKAIQFPNDMMMTRGHVSVEVIEGRKKSC